MFFAYFLTRKSRLTGGASPAISTFGDPKENPPVVREPQKDRLGDITKEIPDQVRNDRSYSQLAAEDEWVVHDIDVRLGNRSTRLVGSVASGNASLRRRIGHILCSFPFCALLVSWLVFHCYISYLLLYWNVKFSTYALALLCELTVIRNTMLSPAANEAQLAGSTVETPVAVFHVEFPATPSVQVLAEPIEMLDVPVVPVPDQPTTVDSGLQVVTPPALAFLNIV